MTAYTDSLGFNKGTAAFPADVTSISKFVVELDFAAIVAARAAAGATALGATDTLQVINLPAYSVVLAAGLNCTKVESTNTTATFDLGYTGGSPAAANVYCDDFACTAVAMDSDNLANPTVIKTADTIDLLLNTAVPTDCVLQAWAIVADCSAV
jgi:hypothetical protein